jgi:hypothetical protein
MDPGVAASIRSEELEKEYLCALEIQDDDVRQATLSRIQRDVEDINASLKALHKCHE